MATVPPCPSCGAESWNRTSSSRWERLRHWLVFGGRRRPRERLVCTECGHEEPVSAVTYPLRSGRPLPMRLVAILRGERSMIPVPLTYLVVLAAGAIVGILLDIATGWRWWLVPLVGIAATWLFFMSSAFWGRHRSRSLGRSILMVLAPGRAAKRMNHETEESFRSLPFPLCGLPPPGGEFGSSGAMEGAAELLPVPLSATPTDPLLIPRPPSSASRSRPHPNTHPGMAMSSLTGWPTQPPQTLPSTRPPKRWRDGTSRSSATPGP